MLGKVFEFEFEFKSASALASALGFALEASNGSLSDLGSGGVELVSEITGAVDAVGAFGAVGALDVGAGAGGAVADPARVRAI